MPGKRPDIPAAIKREVRQRCGFGCVICGVPLIEYDHLLGWAETERHVADELTLLCDLHHRQKTNNLLDAETVRRHNDNPHNMQAGHSGPMSLMFGPSPRATMVVGGNHFTHHQFVAPVVIDGHPLLALFRNESGDWLLDIDAFDWCNRRILGVRSNELIFSTDAWDIQLVGNTLTLNEAANKVFIRIRFEPPGKIVVDRADMLFNGVHFAIRKQEMWANGGPWTFGGNLVNFPVGVLINPRHPENHFNPDAAAFVTDINRYRFDFPSSKQPRYEDPDPEPFESISPS